MCRDVFRFSFRCLFDDTMQSWSFNFDVLSWTRLWRLKWFSKIILKMPLKSIQCCCSLSFFPTAEVYWTVCLAKFQIFFKESLNFLPYLEQHDCDHMCGMIQQKKKRWSLFNIVGLFQFFPTAEVWWIFLLSWQLNWICRIKVEVEVTFWCVKIKIYFKNGSW